MATVYTVPGDAVIGFCLSRASERRFPVPPGAAVVLRFDEATNPVLIHRLRERTREFTVVAGQLHFQGAPVVPNAPGTAYQDWQEVAQLDQVLIRLGNPAPLLEADVRVLLRRLARLVRHLLREQHEQVD